MLHTYTYIYINIKYIFLDISRTWVMDVCESQFSYRLCSNKTWSRFHGTFGPNFTRTTAFTISQFASCRLLYSRVARIFCGQIQRSKVSFVCDILNDQWIIYTFDFFRRYLRETLKMANAEDLNRLTVCALVLLGHIFLSLGNSRESMNMVTPAMQLSSKIPDTHVQLWASAILKGIWSSLPSNL